MFAETKHEGKEGRHLVLNPYHEGTGKTDRFHAVCEDRNGQVTFVSAATPEALSAGTADLNRIRRIVAIYEGKLRDFSESREVRLGE